MVGCFALGHTCAQNQAPAVTALGAFVIRGEPCDC